MKRSLLGSILIGLTAVAATAQPIRPMVGELRGVVSRGEGMFDIAHQNRISVEHLYFANGIHPGTQMVPEGTKVVVPNWRILPSNPPKNGIVINLPERGAYLFRNGKFKNFYPVSIGDATFEKGRFRTRTGEFHIIEKQKNPTWYPPSWAKEKGPVGPGSENPLGDRWIGLSLNRTGIHGTNVPNSVGYSITHGCMRCYPELVRELYDQVEVGMPARIEYETCKVGKGPDGRLYMVTFPDVYGKQQPLTAAKNLINKLGLSKQIKRRNFMDVMALTVGFPVSLQGTEAVSKEVAQMVKWGGVATDNKD
jgi:L,D-transpeptidase ErfK/SrfK